MKLNKWMLFVGAIMMAVMGYATEQRNETYCGLMLMWIGLAVE